MKSIRCLPLVIALMAVALLPQSFVKAGMNAQAIVDQFNSASGGTKMPFIYGYNYYYNYYEVQLTQYGSGFADTSAYAQGVTGGSNYYRTFCVQPNVNAYQYMEATLNYVNGTSSTSSGHVLTLGAAYLYSQFAIGELEGYNYTDSTHTTSSSNLTVAIRALMSITIVNDWAGNPFLKQLFSIENDRNYWTGAYDPNQYYDIIGNYSVFVMNNSEIGGLGRDGQDFLYVACATDSSNVPEPTTLLLWGLSSLGVFGVARKRIPERY